MRQRVPFLYTGRVKQKVPSNMFKMNRLRSSCAGAKSHLGLCSTFIHYVVSGDSVDIEGQDPTARMRSLILAFDVRIFPKTEFRMTQTIYRIGLWASFTFIGMRQRSMCFLQERLWANINLCMLICVIAFHNQQCIIV